MVGAAKAAEAGACSSRPARNRMPSGDSTSRSFAGMKALAPVLRSTSDWCRCQPDEKTFGSFGRHMKVTRSEEHTSELQSLMRISYAVFCLNKKKKKTNKKHKNEQ